MKFPNQEYKMVYRRGTFLDKEALRREHESAPIVALSVMAGLIIILLSISFPSCAHAEVYDSSEIADAIYIIEGGEKAKKPYGILSVPCHNEAECRNICLTTVENQFTRWQADGAKGDFLESLAKRYAPIGASNDPQGLNVNWLKNIKWHLAKEK